MDISGAWKPADERGPHRAPLRRWPAGPADRGRLLRQDGQLSLLCTCGFSPCTATCDGKIQRRGSASLCAQLCKAGEEVIVTWSPVALHGFPTLENGLPLTSLHSVYSPQPFSCSLRDKRRVSLQREARSSGRAGHSTPRTQVLGTGSGGFERGLHTQKVEFIRLSKHVETFRDNVYKTELPNPSITQINALIKRRSVTLHQG